MGNQAPKKVSSGDELATANESQQLLDSKSKPRMVDKEGVELSMTFFGWGLVIVQVSLLFIYGFCTTPYSEVLLEDGVNTDFNAGYNIFSGVLIMMVVGFANLMTFIVNYEIGSVAFTLMITGIITPPLFSLPPSTHLLPNPLAFLIQRLTSDSVLFCFCPFLFLQWLVSNLVSSPMHFFTN